LVEDIANIDINIADDRPGSLHQLIGGNVRGPRFLDPGVLAVGEFRRKGRVTDGRG
jgi:hypothetical protein